MYYIIILTCAHACIYNILTTNIILCARASKAKAIYAKYFYVKSKSNPKNLSCKKFVILFVGFFLLGDCLVLELV